MKYFKDKEFECKGTNCCGNTAAIHPNLIIGLTELRSLIKIPIKILSGFRCNTHNMKIGGEPESYHTKGMAADIKCAINPKDLAGFAEKIPLFKNGGIGIYSSWIHVDVRETGPARWSSQ
jgi:uncharacterized protein YcbK (DUF882 family)